MSAPITVNRQVPAHEKARFLGAGFGDSYVTHQLEYPSTTYYTPPTPKKRWWQYLAFWR